MGGLTSGRQELLKREDARDGVCCLVVSRLCVFRDALLGVPVSSVYCVLSLAQNPRAEPAH